MNESRKQRLLLVGSEEYVKEIGALVERFGYEYEGMSSRGDVVVFDNPKDYSCVVTDISLGDGTDGEWNLRHLVRGFKDKDGFLPVIVSTGRGDELASAKAKGYGASYYVSWKMENWRDNLKDCLYKLHNLEMDVGPVSVLKFGGSFDDFSFDTHFIHMLYAADILMQLHREGKRMICTVGAGQKGVLDKEWERKWEGLERCVAEYQMAVMRSLEDNARRTISFFSLGLLEFVEARYCDLDKFHHLTREALDESIPFLTLAPAALARPMTYFPLAMSDMQTMGIAHTFAADVIYLKRTDGLYKFDPYRGFVLDPETGLCVNWDAWRRAQEGNERYNREVTVDEVLGEVSREGSDIKTGRADGSDDHIVETGALKLYRDVFTRIKSLRIVHAACEEMYQPVADGIGRHIVTGEEIDMPDPREELRDLQERIERATELSAEVRQLLSMGERALKYTLTSELIELYRFNGPDYRYRLLEQGLRNAFNGVTHTTIVRG